MVGKMSQEKSPYVPMIHITGDCARLGDAGLVIHGSGEIWVT